MGLDSGNLDESPESPCLIQVVGAQAQLSFEPVDE
jgi:hypothetical protein